MQIANLVTALSRPEAYPFPVDRVEVHHTHISAVFLAGPFACKVKKPVNLGFLDFSTLERRRRFCEEEVRLNRRLAPLVYLGVVPITLTPDGVQLEGPGDAVEWAVKMERLPEENTLENILRRQEQGQPQLEALARKVAGFHADADRGDRISAFGRLAVVAGNARENFQQARPLVGTTLSSTVFEKLQNRTEESLGNLGPLIEARARRGIPCDTHGDLHLEHVYLFPERKPPDDLVIVDCIEFNERFRFADPVADMAFLVMDLIFHNRRDLAEAFTRTYFNASRDNEGLALLPFYTAYRAAVRAKVEGFEFTEKEVPLSERAAALARARAHWLLALAELEPPQRKPCLLLVGGLPGSGKSTLAHGLADRSDFHLLRTDVIRKELAGLKSEAVQSSPLDEDCYSSDWTDRTYAECLTRAEECLFRGDRVLIDATFREAKHRELFLDAAARWAVPIAFLHCQASEAVVRQRLQDRKNDASDAVWTTYLKLAAQWQPPGPRTRSVTHTIDADVSPEQVVAQAYQILQSLGLA